MKYFVSVDADNYVNSYTNSLEAPEGSEWIEVSELIDISLGATRLKLLPDGSVIDTGIPAFPSTPYQVWDGPNGQWVDGRTLVELKEATWEDMKALRDAEEFGGLTYGGVVYDTDAMSQQRIQGAVQLAQLDMANFTIDWTVADNSVVTLDGSAMLGLGISLGVHISTVHAKGRSVRVLVDAALDEAELQAITWP